MYAIVEIAGQQFKVVKDQKVIVHRLQGKEGDDVVFDNVLLTNIGDEITIGTPVVKEAQVKAKILTHVKGDKVIVFKKKRRKGYQVKNGHRQALTEIAIQDISVHGVKPVVSKKEEAPQSSLSGKSDNSEAAIAAHSQQVAKETDKKDDLTKMEGIGPKIQEVLNSNGITTYLELSKTTPTQLSEFIKDVKGNHIPDTWAKQAELAHQGEWEALKEWQDRLDGGIEKE